MNVHVGLLVTLEAKPGRQDEVAQFLEAGQTLAEGEPQTVSWYAFRLTETTFGIFDTFADDDGRDLHLSGQIAKALGEIADDLLASPPDIQPIDVFASKLGC
jgi:quinol monooxygenase YgiN